MDRAWLRLRDGHYRRGREASLFCKFDQPEYPNARDLRNAISSAWQVRPELRPRPSEVLCESVGKVLLTLQNVTDNANARLLNPADNRLDVGLNFEAIRSLLASCDITAGADDVSVAVDVCVDSGLAVPRVISENHQYFRAFYCGESEWDQPLPQFKLAISQAYRDFLQAAKPLTPFDVHKLCVCLKDVMPWLPVSTRFHTYGRTAVIGMGQEELLHWLTDPDVGPLWGVSKGGRQVLVPNESFKPATELSWPSSQVRDFMDGFQFTANAFAKLSDEAKLLLSTCRTQQHTYNASAYEIYSWIGNGNRSFHHLLQLCRAAVAKGEPSHHTVVQDAYWCITYISEAYKKHLIFSRHYQKLLTEVEKCFVRQGQPAARWWEICLATPFLTRGLTPQWTADTAFL